MRLPSLSQTAFAATMVGLGLLGLSTGGFAGVWVGVPESLPAREVLAWVSAGVSLVTGLGLLWRRSKALAAAVVSAYLLFWMLAFKAPPIFAAPLSASVWESCGETAAVTPLRVFLAHELFHRYHYQAAGFSDDPGEHQAIWRTLWAEGLATYASYKLIPGSTVDQALIAPPDLAAKAAPKVAEISAALLAELDAPNHQIYQTYFTYGEQAATKIGLPWRSGYFVGFLIAQKLGRTYSLQALAQLKGPALHRQIRQALEFFTTKHEGSASGLSDRRALTPEA